MADQFQIPNRTPPQATPPAPPYELVSKYLDRPYQNAEAVSGNIDKVTEYLNKQKQLKAGAFEAGGPGLLQYLYGGGSQPQAGGGVPSGPNQNMTPLAQQPQQGTIPAPQTQAQSIQPSIDPHAPGGTIHTSINVVGNPDHGSIHAQKIRDLQQQMGQNAQMGKYGQTLNTGVKDQLNAETALMGAEQFQQGQQRQQQQFDTSQANEEDRFQRSEANKIRGTVAGAQKDIRQKATASDTAQDALNTFAKTFVGKGPKGEMIDLTAPSSIPFVTGASANVASKSGGRFGNKSGGNMVERRKVLANAMVGILTSSGRVAPQVANDLVAGLIPNPDELTNNKLEKMDELQRLIDTVRAGDQATIDNMISTLTNSDNSVLRK